MTPTTRPGRALAIDGEPIAGVLRAALLIAFVLPAGCTSVAPSYALDLPVASRYVYRGAVFNDDPVVQPEAYASLEDDAQCLTLGVFTNYETSDENDSANDFTEIDPYVEYGRQLGSFWVSLGQTTYFYPNTDFDPTSEVYLIVATELAGISAALETWYDYREADGLYLNLNVGHERPLSDRVDLALSAGIGYMRDGQAEYYFGVSESGLSDALLQASLAYAVSAHVTFSVVGAYARVIDSDLRDAVDEPDNAWVAVGTSIRF